MKTEPRGLRLLCPQGCGDMLTVPVPTLAEVSERSGDMSLGNLDALVGRNVVGAVMMHCIYTCTAIPDGHPMMHVADNPVSDTRITNTSPSVPSAPADRRWLMTSRRSK
jgi:hypothetical protein